MAKLKQLKKQQEEKFIVNGHRATAGQFPWHVSILRPEAKNRELVHVAGGIVIAPKFVLTAAHVVVPVREYHLRFNSLNLWSGGETQVSREAIIHEKYNEETLQNNIAIIILPQALNLGRNTQIRAVRLPCQNDVSPSLTGQRARLSGHGVNEKGQISSHLRFIDMQVIDNVSCRGIYNNRVTPSVLCAVGWFR